MREQKSEECCVSIRKKKQKLLGGCFCFSSSAQIISCDIQKSEVTRLPMKQIKTYKVHIKYLVEATDNLKGYHSHQTTDLTQKQKH